MCSPCGPMVCYKYEDCGPPKSDRANKAAEGSAAKKDEKENQLKRTKSRELRGGIMYYSCHCIKRNGLQHDCRRTGCGGEPACLTLPDPVCAPSQLARARGLADPAPLAAHLHGGQHGADGSGRAADPRTGGGKKFIVCELKGILPEVSVDKSGKCCKCPATHAAPAQNLVGGSGGVACFSGSAAPKPPVASAGNSKCPCSTSGPIDPRAVFVFDEKTINTILQRFEGKETAAKNLKAGPGGRIRTEQKPAAKEVCTRPGCLHWQPPPPCVWDLPCKADCFEAHPGIQPGRNPWRHGVGSCTIEGKPVVGGGGSADPKEGGAYRPREKMKLTPHCCTGCHASSDGGAAAASGGPAAGLPVLVMKLC